MGNRYSLWTHIPHISRGEWALVTQYDGWPNGLKIHRDGSIFLADYKNGILRLDPQNGQFEPVVWHRQSEHFRGCNDLVFDSQGRLYFTDQGQSGMHMPNGRVYRYDLETNHLELLIDTGQSPNGLVLNEQEDTLYVAMTRGNAFGVFLCKAPFPRWAFPSTIGWPFWT